MPCSFSAHHDDAPVREGQVPGERNEARARRVLLGMLQAGNGGLRVARAGRPDERRRLDLELGASGRAADDEVSAVEVTRGHEAVDVLDASLGELSRVCEQRHATGQERAFGEGRSIVWQSKRT